MHWIVVPAQHARIKTPVGHVFHLSVYAAPNVNERRFMTELEI